MPNFFSMTPPTPTTLGGILGVVRFADQFAGANAGAKIAAAIADLPSTGGIVDARALAGAQTLTNFFSGVTKPVTVFLGVGTYSASVAIVGASNLRLVGAGRGATIIVNTTTTAIIGSGSIEFEVSELTVQGGTAGVCSQIGFDLSGWQNGRLINVEAQFCTIGFFLGRPASVPCFFNDLVETRAYSCIKGYVLDGSIASPNNNTFYHPMSEDVTGVNTTGYEIGGLGNRFFSPYTGSASLVGVKFGADSADNLLEGLYIESNPTTGIDASATPIDRGLTVIDGIHFDGTPVTKISDPNRTLMILYNSNVSIGGWEVGYSPQGSGDSVFGINDRPQQGALGSNAIRFSIDPSGGWFNRATSNQLHFAGNTNPVVLTVPNPSASRVITLPDPGADCALILAAGGPTFTSQINQSMAEPIISMAATAASGKTWKLISGGGAEIGAGVFGLQDTTDGRNVMRVSPASAADSISITGTGVGILTAAPSVALDVTGDIKTSTKYNVGATAGVTAGSFSAITAITATGGIVTQLTGTSDERLKTGIIPFERGLSDILKVQPIRYRWNEEGQKKTGFTAEQEFTGFSAQNVQGAIPEAIGQEGEYLSFSDRPVLAALVNAVKELSQRIEELKNG